MNTYIHHTILRPLARFLLLAAAAVCAPNGAAQCNDCDDCSPRLALKSNLVHDALLTPDLGLELSLARVWSVSAQGVWAGWSKDSRHRYWHIHGGNLELRRWFGAKSRWRALSGHHVGVYGAMYKFDIEFGGKGWQSRGPVFSGGVSYGYSFALGRRLSLDLSARIGYLGGNVTEYKPQCGVYTCTGQKHIRYFGPTDLEVTLVWFPGVKSKNRPDF